MLDKKTISFSVTLKEYESIRHNAKSKGSTPSTFCKNAIFSHINKYPAKGFFAELDRIEHESKL